MSFDGFFMHHLVLELNQELKDARLEKIQVLDVSRFLFHFYRRGQKMKLLISCDAGHFGAYLTEKNPPVIANNQLVIQLKKHLEGGFIEQVRQHLTDRVMIFDFRINDMIDGMIKKELIFEAMGKHSNLILVHDGLIIDTHKKMFFETGRQLLPSATFEFFPSDKKPFTKLSYEGIFDRKDLVNTYLGISPILASYLYTHKPFLMSIEKQPTFDITDHKFYSFDLFDASHKKIYYDTLSHMLDAYQPKKGIKVYPQLLFIEREIKKADRKLEHLKADLDDAKQSLDHKLFADLIYQSSMDLYEKRTDLTVGDTVIRLDAQLTLNENAQLFYKKYQKAKRTIAHLINQIDTQKAYIQDLLDLETYIEISKDDDLSELDVILLDYGYKVQKKPQKKKQTTPAIMTFQLDDITIYVGKNSLQNQHVTHTLGTKEDYWFHVKGAPGSHVVAKTDHLNEKTLRVCAMLAAYFSKMRESQSIPVDYTQIKYLKKIPKTPLHKVSYSKNKTIYIDIDQEKIDALLSK